MAREPIVRLPPTDPKSKFAFRASAVTVVGDRFYLGTHDGHVLALESRSGRRVWNFATGDSVLSAPSVEGARVYVGSFDGKVYALDARSGRSVWERDVLGLAWGQPAVTDDRVFIGTRASRGLVHHRAAFFALDRASGQVAWWYPLSPPAGGGPHRFPASAATGNGLVFVGALDGRVYAFEAKR